MTNYNFERYNPAGKRVWYELPLEGDPAPQLLMTHAGRSNRAYTQAVATANAKSGAIRRAARGKISLTMIDDSIALDRKLFSKHVIVGWKGIQDSAGKDVVFSEGEVAQFLNQIPDWMMQEISAYAGTPENFVTEDEPTPAELDEQSGN